MFISRVKFNFEFTDPCLCNAWVAAAVIGSSVLGAGATIFGATKGAEAQTDASNKAIALQQQQYGQTREDLSPYRTTGTDATARLQGKLTDLTTPISVNPDDFLNSDQYKFLQTQGEKAVTNSSAARGLGTSGAALKGAAAFESGLNSQQWQQNFNNQNTNQSNAYSRLKGLIDTGENAAAQTGVLGEKAAYNSGVATVGAGNAQAAADNKIGSAFTQGGNNLAGYAMAKGLYGGSSGPAITYGGPNGPTTFS